MLAHGAYRRGVDSAGRSYYVRIGVDARGPAGGWTRAWRAWRPRSPPSRTRIRNASHRSRSRISYDSTIPAWPGDGPHYRCCRGCWIRPPATPAFCITY